LWLKHWKGCPSNVGYSSSSSSSSAPHSQVKKKERRKAKMIWCFEWGDVGLKYFKMPIKIKKKFIRY
jgi:hypothetical protein